MLNLKQFAKDYYGTLHDILLTLPSGVLVPQFLKNTSFVIACSDKIGKVAIDILSRANITEIVWDGKTISAISEGEPEFLIAPDLPNLESFLFPQDDKRTSVSITIGEPHIVLDGLAFSNKEYNDKYWSEAKFYRNCVGSIPFKVTSTGAMLGLDLLWGAELDGKRQERLFEFIKIYGSKELLPTESRDLQDEAFRDFGHAVPKLGKELEKWSFTDFLNSLQTSIDRNVLLLGSYKSEKEFAQLKGVLEELGYNGFLLKDSPDLPIQSNLEKLFSAIICSCFIIVVDKQASGHIAELGHLLQLRFRPVIVLRESKTPTTTFLEDRILTDEFFRIAIVNEISPQVLLPYIIWARALIAKQIGNYNSINDWRKK